MPFLAAAADDSAFAIAALLSVWKDQKYVEEEEEEEEEEEMW